MARDGLPVGTVTFLLTDVEGSTRLWDERPATMARVMARHDAIVGEVVAAHGGHLLKTRGEGDSTFSVFSSPVDAVSAAFALQLAVGAEAWEDDARLAVRVAVHTGAAELRDGDYFGGTVNRTARLRGVAHAGQVLVSEATAELTRGQLPQGASLRDLGVHQLRDLARPERVHQLTHPDLPDHFAPLRTDAGRAGNLPLQLTTFIGRERERTELSKLVDERRLVTVMGVGGAGKTRLALEVAAAAADRFADGAWFVAMAPVNEPELVADTVASTVGVREQAGASVLEALAAELRPRTMLLVLDNCEHVVDAAAAVVDVVLRECPDVRILATSRQTLGVAGEATFALAPMQTPPPGAPLRAGDLEEFDALRLFVERAALAGVTLGADDVAAVAEVCNRVDGIPLAIELAAARTAVLTPGQVAARLDDSFKLLSTTGRTVDARQRSLQGAIDWSYELLGDDERAVFRRLAVFAGAFTLEGAEAVCGDAALDLLSQLVGKSLVIHEHGQYRMLETIRAYALEKLREAGGEPTARQAHFDWVRAATRDGEPRQLLAHLDDVRAALAWAIDEGNDIERGFEVAVQSSDAWTALSRWSEMRTWLERARSRGGVSRSLRSRCMRVAALAAAQQGDLTAVRRLATEAVESADSPRERADAMYVMGNCLQRLGDYAAATECYDEAATLVDLSGDRTMAALLDAGKANVEAALGNLDAARLLYASALEQLRAIGVEEAPAIVGNLVRVLYAQGEHDEAERLAHQVVDAARSRGDLQGTAHAVLVLGKVALTRGDVAAAAANGEEAIDLFRSLGDRFSLAAALYHQAECLRAAREFDTARALAAESMALFEEAGHPLGAAALSLLEGEIALDAGDTSAAVEPLLQAAGALSELGDALGQIAVLDALARVAARRGAVTEAVRWWAAAAAAREARGAHPAPHEVSRIEDALASARAELGDRFDDVWSGGRSLSLAEGLREARAAIGAAEPGSR